MAESDGKKKTNRFLDPPRLALVSDAPIESEDAGADDFDRASVSAPFTTSCAIP